MAAAAVTAAAASFFELADDFDSRRFDQPVLFFGLICAVSYSANS
jgi:hypothetical protein